jgi:two-component system, OmpR family, response regulator
LPEIKWRKAVPKTKILVVEDDNTLLDILSYNLMKEGYNVLVAEDGASALEIARKNKPDILILDIMLPELDGFEVCRILRKEMTIPILMLTAKVEETDKVVGLELGADDYMTKPFSFRELLARLKALLRRVERSQSVDSNGEEMLPAPASAGNLVVDFNSYQVSRGEEVLDLNHREFALLAFLIKRRGQVFTRDQLLEKVWGYDYAGDTRTVDVHIRWLRQKIETDAANPQWLLTVRGVGYKFRE